jgi:hypothetical protein
MTGLSEIRDDNFGVRTEIKEVYIEETDGTSHTIFKKNNILTLFN